MAHPLTRQPLSTCDIVNRSNAGFRAFRTTSGNIAAIDFGTTSVSIAYTTVGSKNVNDQSTVKIPQFMKLGTRQETRVPNAILFKKVDGGVTLESIGDTAQKAYEKARDKTNIIFFEKIKMSMKRKEVRVYSLYLSIWTS